MNFFLQHEAPVQILRVALAQHLMPYHREVAKRSCGNCGSTDHKLRTKCDKPCKKCNAEIFNATGHLIKISVLGSTGVEKHVHRTKCEVIN